MTGMAKIGIIMSSLFACGGEERVVSLMANEWVKYHEVTIFTYENREAEGGNKNDFFLSDQVEVQRVDSRKDNVIQKTVRLLYYYTGMTSGKISEFLLQKTFFPGGMLDEWVRRIGEGGFDLMIGVSGIYTMLLGQVKNRISAKVVGWEHSSYEGYFARRKGYLRNQEKAFKTYVSRLDACVVLNDDIKHKYGEKLGLDVTVIHNPRSFTSDVKADCMNRCFVTCGRLEAEKAYDDLITAFYHFSKADVEWKLVIIGGGSLQESLEKLAGEYGISDRVTITGYVNNVEELLRQGSVFVMTSRWEGFPMSVTEALEMGLPVISYDIPAMQPLVADGVEGRIVPAFDNSALVDAMKELAYDKDMRRRMSEAAIRKATEFSAEKIAGEWYGLFAKLQIESG